MYAWVWLKYDYKYPCTVNHHMCTFFSVWVTQTFAAPLLRLAVAPAMRYTMPRSIFCPTQGASSSNRLSAVHTRVKHSSSWSLAKDNKPNLDLPILIEGLRPFVQKDVARCCFGKTAHFMESQRDICVCTSPSFRPKVAMTYHGISCRCTWQIMAYRKLANEARSIKLTMV